MPRDAFLDRILDILPRPYLNEIAARHCGVGDPLPIVRTSLKKRINDADSRDLRQALAVWIARQLLPDAETLNLR
jgi:hypothetical protein